ncbi:MAG TPA: hypothetical protein VIM57_07295 [Luteolibacter sp.]
MPKTKVISLRVSPDDHQSILKERLRLGLSEAAAALELLRYGAGVPVPATLQTKTASAEDLKSFAKAVGDLRKSLLDARTYMRSSHPGVSNLRDLKIKGLEIQTGLLSRLMDGLVVTMTSLTTEKIVKIRVVKEEINQDLIRLRTEAADGGKTVEDSSALARRIDALERQLEALELLGV